jgi:hypothetical protein
MFDKCLASGSFDTLAGFEYSINQDGHEFFNFIMTNGVRSHKQNDHRVNCSTALIPVDEIKRIKSVNIFSDRRNDYGQHISGFQFFDKKNKLILKIGDTFVSSQTTILLKENEHIIGVIAKNMVNQPTIYSNF